MMEHSGPSSRLSLLSLPPLLVSILLLGCGGDGPEAIASATVDTVGGVEELTYPAVAGPQLAWPVDTVLILGDAMAEPGYQFGMPGDAQLAGDGRGHIYVADEEGSSARLSGMRMARSW